MSAKIKHFASCLTSNIVKNPSWLSSGFTLIELLFTVSIIIILALIAYSTYQDSVLRTRRAEARSALHSVMLQQERYYTQHNTYSAFNVQSKDSKNALFKWWSGDSVANSYYEISAAPCPEKQLNQCVLLTATSGTPNVRNAHDPVCGNLMLDSANNKSSSGNPKPASPCW